MVGKKDEDKKEGLLSPLAPPPPPAQRTETPSHEEMEQLQHALSDSELRYHTLFQESVDPIYIFDPESKRLLEANQAFRALLGYQKSVIHHLSIYEFIAHTPANVDALVEQIQSAGETAVLERHWRRNDGSRVLVQLRASLIQQDNRQVVMVLGRRLDEHRQMQEALHNTQQSFRNLIEGHIDSMLVVDENGAIRFANAAARAMLGAPSTENALLDQPIGFPIVLEQATEITLPSTDDGQRGVGELRVMPTIWEGAPARLLSIRDISAQKRAEEELRKSEERYALAVRGANDGLWDWDISHNSIYYSPRWKEILGYAADELTHSPNEWLMRVHPDDFLTLERELQRHLEGHSDQFELEHRMRHKDGTYRWVLSRGVALHHSDGKVYRMAGSQTDITDRKHAEQRLLHDALHDQLTGLPNRTLFLDRLQSAIQQLQRRVSYQFAVLFLDLDRFKNVNDTMGHLLGDKLLIQISQRILSCVREVDTVARLGGDEFAVLLDGIQGPHDAIQIADRINAIQDRPFSLAGPEIYTTVSIGIALSQTGYQDAEELLRDADIAMYRAKSRGRDRYAIFDSAMREHVSELMQLENDLRGAVSRQEFVLHYQPIVELETTTITGFEALLRWQHPSRGLIGPDVFIELAEEMNLINNIGWWVLEEASRQLAEWRQLLPPTQHPTLSINLSSQQLQQTQLIEELASLLEVHRIPGSQLKMEITESLLLEGQRGVLQKLQQLKQLGIGVHMDDFGTGYSSLSYLHTFPFDGLKIDRSFISQLHVDDDKFEIVRSIVNLAHNLGLYVTAEGIETPKQLELVQSLFCEFGQGYHFSRPVTAPQATALLRSPPF